MDCKKATLVINPRTGENVAKITDVLAILAAAGWKTDIELKEYGGHSLQLAQQASEDKSDFVIAYGGDGTLSQVVNGVMNTKKSHSAVGVIPGGTANVWAGEIGIPVDPVKAALALVNSEARKVDVGHVEVGTITYAEDTAQESQAQDKKKSRKKKKKASVQGSSKAKHHFLLMAGLGIDAAVMQGVSKPLKYRVGTLAVGLAAAKKLPEQHAFPIEIRAEEDGREGDVLWKGEALQVVIGNTRRYADIAEMTPNAYIDDGILDVCVITGGDPLNTMQQVASLLLRRKPDNTAAEYFHGAHLEVTVPASVPLQLDGSAVKLKDYINKADYTKLQQEGETETEQAKVTYHFDAVPRALEIAIPQTYNYELFEHTNEHENVQQEDAEREQEHVKADVKTHGHNGGEESQTAQQEHAVAVEERPTHDQNGNASDDVKEELPDLVGALLENGRKVTVVGKVPLAGKKRTYIIAGGTMKASTGETRPVAVVVNEKTTVYNHQGNKLPAQAMEELQEGATIIVEGDKSKRGVIGATRLVM